MTERVPNTTAEERDELRARAGTHGRDPRYVISVPSSLLYGLLDDCVAAEAELTELRHDLANLMNCDYGPKGVMWDGNGESAVIHLRAHLEDLAKTHDTRHPELVHDLMANVDRWRTLAQSLLTAIRMGHELDVIQKRYAQADEEFVRDTDLVALAAAVMTTPDALQPFQRTPWQPHCDECDWTFGCFNGPAACRKKPLAPP